MMTRKRLLLIQAPAMAIFVAGFLATELGSRGAIRSAFFQQEIYSRLSRVPAALTDWKFKLRGPTPASPRVVIVDIDDDSIRRLGRWPWPRDRTALLLEEIFRHSPRVVGLDMILSEQEERIPEDLATLLQSKGMGDLLGQFEPDRKLARTIARHRDRLVLGWASDLTCQPVFGNCPEHIDRLGDVPQGFRSFGYSMVSGEFDASTTPLLTAGALLPPVPDMMAASAHLGSTNDSPDEDGYVRKAPLAILVEGTPHPTLPLEVARVGLHDRLSIKMGGRGGIESIHLLKTGLELPVSPLGAVLVNFRGGQRSFTYVSAADILQAADWAVESPPSLVASKRGPAASTTARGIAALNDAFVLVGVSALAAGDIRSFPFAADVPGVEGQATVLENILTNDFLKGGGALSFFSILLAMTLGTAALLMHANREDAVRTIASFVGVIAIIGELDSGYLFPAGYNWNTGFLYLELSTMAVILLGMRYISEEKGRKFLKLAFSRYVSPHVVDSIVKDPEQLKLGGQKKNLTIMFSDIRSFTTFSEKMDAKTLAEFLNDYLGIMTDLVFKHDGTLDKYIGDALMAFWGAPLDVTRHAAQACEAARRMIGALEQHRARWLERYKVDVAIGVGINTAIVNVGNMGSERTFGYTVIGDGVNLASRLEGATKAYGVSILTTQETLDAILESGSRLPPHRILDELKVKGKNKAVRIAQILPPGGELGIEVLDKFQDGRRAYRERRWDDAIALFQSVSSAAAKEPSAKPDGPSEVYIQRCLDFKEAPPEPEWDGSWKMDSK